MEVKVLCESLDVLLMDILEKESVDVDKLIRFLTLTEELLRNLKDKHVA